MAYYQKHIFFCTNLREPSKRCCGANQTVELRDYAKQKLKKMGLHGVGEYRVNNAGCLGRCEDGPVLVIYPEEVWYSYKTHNDIDEIIEQHLLKGQIVSRLLLPSEPFMTK